MNEWILVDEKLPDTGERVLVYGEYPVYGSGVSYRRGITIGKFDGCYEKKWKHEAFIGLRVIAWTRLPEPPKEV